VSEQREVIGVLGEAGVLAGIRWAYLSATARSLATYSPADGHDAAWLGNTRFTLFRNRLDRVFSCDRYATSSGNGDNDLDLLFAELSEDDRDAMPRLRPGLVVRSDFNGSPGWSFEEWRFLLAASAFGKLDRMPWPQKSPTKQRVAGQTNPEPPQPTLFEAFADDEIGGLESVLAPGAHLDKVTYVVGHSCDPVREQMELVFGRARLNAGGGQAWHWRQDLLGVEPADTGRRSDPTNPSATPNAVPDAPVRLRRQPQERRDDSASGQQ
jgi:hypothetical protein